MSKCRKGPKPIDIRDRFWAKVDKRSDDECWNWTANKLKRGYGLFYQTQPRATLYAHRFSWVLHFGPIPNKLQVCHRCDNPSCVNPKHLFVGTALDNIRDMDAKNRRKTIPCPKGKVLNSKITRDIAQQIRELYAELPTVIIKQPGETAKLAQRFGISQSQLWNIAMNKCWGNNA